MRRTPQWPRKVFVNLPVKDLARSTEFFTGLGFPLDRRFSDEQIRLAWSSATTSTRCSLTEPFFQSFTARAIPDTSKTAEAIVALEVESRHRVDELAEQAVGTGGSPAGEPMEEYGMYVRRFEDPDGHLWEVFHMEPIQDCGPGGLGMTASVTILIQDELVYRIFIQATAQEVWDALTMPGWTQKYGYRARVKVRPGAGRDLPGLRQRAPERAARPGSDHQRGSDRGRAAQAARADLAPDVRRPGRGRARHPPELGNPRRADGPDRRDRQPRMSRGPADGRARGRPGGRPGRLELGPERPEDAAGNGQAADGWTTKRGGQVAHIVVMGGGLNGLTAGILLADGHQVTVTERDAAGPRGNAGDLWQRWDRRGVNQFRQVHFMLPRWRALMGAGAARGDRRARGPGRRPHQHARRAAG